MFYGYARVSTLDQDLTLQRAALKAAGCEVIRAEKGSGTRRDGRTDLQVLLDAGNAQRGLTAATALRA
jgi:DNA invertase Pin-like site-specific DNA recombinase